MRKTVREIFWCVFAGLRVQVFGVAYSIAFIASACGSPYHLHFFLASIGSSVCYCGWRSPRGPFFWSVRRFAPRGHPTQRNRRLMVSCCGKKRESLTLRPSQELRPPTLTA